MRIFKDKVSLSVFLIGLIGIIPLYITLFKKFSIENILVFILYWFIATVSVFTIIRIFKFYKKIKNLEEVKLYSKKNILLLLASILWIIGMPFLIYFFKELIKSPLSMVLIVIIVLIFGIHSFLGVVVEDYKRNNINNYNVEEGSRGSELFGVNIGEYKEGFIIDTYIFKYSDIDYFEMKNEILYIYGKDSVNDDDSDYKIILQTKKSRDIIKKLIENKGY